MNALVVIPARLESTRLRHKLLRKLGDYSVIEHVCARVSTCDVEWVVATDSAEIYDLIDSRGWPVLMTRSDHSCGTERCAEVLHHYTEADIIVNVQGDEPFVSREDISCLVRLFDSPEVDIATLCTGMVEGDYPEESMVKAIISNGGQALDFVRSIEPHASVRKHIGVYAFRRDVLERVVELPPSPLEIERRLEQMRWMEAGYSIHAVYTEHQYLSIDTATDLYRAEDHLIKIKHQ